MKTLRFDHIALSSLDIRKSVNWYRQNLNAEVLYQDETWAVVQVSNVKIAFVLPNKHPAHFCFELIDDESHPLIEGKNFRDHRDGSSSVYIRDPDGNFIEFLKWDN